MLWKPIELFNEAEAALDSLNLKKKKKILRVEFQVCMRSHHAGRTVDEFLEGPKGHINSRLRGILEYQVGHCAVLFP